jgi:hypothetical protein
VTLSLQSTHAKGESLIANFFQQSAGQWRSERRYYTLPDGDVTELVSLITVRFLAVGCAELQHLAELHLLSDRPLVCGAEVSWHSTDAASGRKKSKGTTLFGVKGDTLYRDRGFATPHPVTAQFHFTHPTTLCLRTEYNDSVFEEELKLIGHQYRTRQTIISRAGEQQMIGQYLERRLA